MPQEHETGSAKDQLEALRREIDRLDDAMLALVEQRVTAAMGVAELKRSEHDPRLRLRPAREAAVIERLVGQARNSPEPLVRQIWQEIMAGCLGLQVDTELVLYASRNPAILVDAMRKRFGCAARMRIAASPEEALRIARGNEAVAVVELDRSGNWWTELQGDEVISPFECLRDDGGAPIGLAVGRIAAEDLRSCPHIVIAEEATVGDRDDILSSWGSLRLVLQPSWTAA
jgi:chorismate mutase